MAKPEKPLAYSLPVLEIESCVPSVEHEDKIYARSIRAKDIDNKSYTIHERIGIEVEQYIGKPLECVLEIVKARFFDLENKNNKPPEDAVKGTFIGIETGYKFIPELVAIVDGETEDDGFDSDEYEVLELKLFSEWGVYGFGLDVDCDKPMLKTENGVFLLNEFIFEEWIDKWMASESIEKPVCFIIEELLLHGIKPYNGKWEKKKKISQYGIVLEEGESYIVGKPKFLEKYG